LKFFNVNSQAWSTGQKISTMKIGEHKFCNKCVHQKGIDFMLCAHPCVREKEVLDSFERYRKDRYVYPRCSGINVDGNCQLYEKKKKFSWKKIFFLWKFIGQNGN